MSLVNRASNILSKIAFGKINKHALQPVLFNLEEFDFLNNYYHLHGSPDGLSKMFKDCVDYLLEPTENKQFLLTEELISLFQLEKLACYTLHSNHLKSVFSYGELPENIPFKPDQKIQIKNIFQEDEYKKIFANREAFIVPTKKMFFIGCTNYPHALPPAFYQYIESFLKIIALRQFKS